MCISDGDSLIWSLDNAPAGMVIDANTGALRWNPSQSQIGTQTIDVLVTDNQGAVTTQTYNLVVGTTPINQAPSIISTPKFTTDSTNIGIKPVTVTVQAG